MKKTDYRSVVDVKSIFDELYPEKYGIIYERAANGSFIRTEV